MKEFLLEILWVVKNCFTTFWFWLPILYAGYVLLQLWMIFYVHPLTFALLPAILSIYGVLTEERRMKTQHGIQKTKILKASHGIGIEPALMSRRESEVEKAVEEYVYLLEKRKRNRKKNMG